MAHKHGEALERSLSTHLDAVEYPTTRDLLQTAAMENAAPADLINVLKCLPSYSYLSKTEVLRDLAEASRRFATGNLPDTSDGVDRRRDDIGREPLAHQH